MCRQLAGIAPVQGARERPIVEGLIGHGRSTRVTRSPPPTITLAKGHAVGTSAVGCLRAAVPLSPRKASSTARHGLLSEQDRYRDRADKHPCIVGRV